MPKVAMRRPSITKTGVKRRNCAGSKFYIPHERVKKKEPL
jgi:hypothetical protein